MTSEWEPRLWRGFEARQQPLYPDAEALEAVLRELVGHPPLVPLAEVLALKTELAEAQAGRAFVLQAGDCAESFQPVSPGPLHESLALLDSMAEALGEAASLPVVRIARVAGQFAKPRSRELDERGGSALPVFRGEIVNGPNFEAEARTPDPERMLRAWRQSAEILSRLRRRQGPLPVYAGHEALLLPYEEALVRREEDSWYGSSAPFLWVGDRTRFDGSAHVEFLRGLVNPIGIKCGPGLTPDLLLRLLDRLDPRREPGRTTLIVRLGADRVADGLPPLLRAVRREGRPVLWVCDPMHGNTRRTAAGLKTRDFGRVAAEVTGFLDACRSEAARPGGLHLEITAREVTECTGGPAEIGDHEVGLAYETLCDPRLNPAQAMAVAAAAAAALRRGLSPLAA